MLNIMANKVAVYRKEHFNAAHRLHNSSLGAKENELLFGKCNLPNYHGHNYELVVKVVGEIDPVTGYVIDTKELSSLVNEHIITKFDHKNLNLDVPEFTNLNPTAENIAVVIFNILRPLLSEQLSLQIRLYETPRNFVEYPII
jgi:6-pyruvoyltetrahydropterin/6-carboxytetrahydropterin synthase